jgi:hypothetical protein
MYPVLSSQWGPGALFPSELWSLAPSLVSSATTNSTARSHLTQLRLPSTNQTQEVSKVKGVPSLRLVGFIDASSNHSLVYPDVPGR